MIQRSSVLAAAVALTIGVSALWAPGQQTQATPGDAALAARFAEMGRDALRGKTIPEPSWRASAAMLAAASKLDPSDARYPRLLVDARLQTQDREGAIDALKAWLKADPTNVSARVQLIDLYLLRMESSDAKLAYLTDILGKPQVDEQVRSHAAVVAARLLMDRSETEQAEKMLATALRLNPLNIDALRMQYQKTATKGTALERTNAMLALLRANPGQAQVMAALAEQLASVGLPAASLEWFNMAGGLGVKAGMPPSPGFIAGYVSELIVGGQMDAAQKLVGQILTANPGAVEVWFLKLTMDKAGGVAADFDASKSKAGVALSNRLQEVRSKAGEKGATTRPVDAGGGLMVPDLAGDLSAVKARTTTDVRDAYVAVLADIAWYQTYFLEQPVSPGVMDFLRQSLPADNVTLARIEGWNSLVQGKADDAKVKLSAIADRDPLAKLGMMKMAAKGDATNAEERKLLNDNPSGLLGAILVEAMKGNPAVQLIKSPQAEAIEGAVGHFPKDLLKILDTPQEFYAVRGEPLQIAHGFGEPLVVQVTIQNLSDYDLTVGTDGVIHPDLWFDARLRGGVDQQVPGVAYDRIADAGVLKSRKEFTQKIRLDQGQFGQVLASNPSVSVQVQAGVMTNPQPAQNGLVPGVAGYRVEFPRVMERVATPISGAPQRQKIYTTIANGNGDEKIRAMELLGTYVRVIRGGKDVSKEALGVADEMVNAIRTGMSDAEPSVQAWAEYISALVGPPEQLGSALKQMMADKSWEKRMLALSVEPMLPAEIRTQVGGKMGLDDADPTVKAYAQAQGELQAIAATQPAAAPTTKP
ncbi:MAG TPA: hypothetical protein VFE58_13255 [Tepidisphaeraceae bacterium]|jgi:tetratricopeptide (TPR) repeat protein|nr:hypothetical protein [Tepidisphaeraceae bacterium]